MIKFYILALTFFLSASASAGNNNLQKKHQAQMKAQAHAAKIKANACLNEKKVSFKKIVLATLRSGALTRVNRKFTILGTIKTKQKMKILDYDNIEFNNYSSKSNRQLYQILNAEVFVEFKKQGVCRVLLKDSLRTKQRRKVHGIYGYAYCKGGNFYIIGKSIKAKKCN